MFFVTGLFLKVIGALFLIAILLFVVSLPLVIPYYLYIWSYSKKHDLPDNFSFFIGFFKFYFQVLRFKRPTF